MAEVIKYGMILDEALFEAIEDGSAIKDIAKLVHRTVELKASVVEEDEERSHPSWASGCDWDGNDDEKYTALFEIYFCPDAIWSSFNV